MPSDCTTHILRSNMVFSVTAVRCVPSFAVATVSKSIATMVRLPQLMKNSSNAATGSECSKSSSQVVKCTAVTSLKQPARVPGHTRLHLQPCGRKDIEVISIGTFVAFHLTQCGRLSTPCLRSERLIAHGYSFHRHRVCEAPLGCVQAIANVRKPRVSLRSTVS